MRRLSKRREYRPGAPLYARAAMKLRGVELRHGDLIPADLLSPRKHKQLWFVRKADHVPPRAAATAPAPPAAPVEAVPAPAAEPLTEDGPPVLPAPPATANLDIERASLEAPASPLTPATTQDHQQPVAPTPASSAVPGPLPPAPVSDATAGEAEQLPPTSPPPTSPPPAHQEPALEPDVDLSSLSPDEIAELEAATAPPMTTVNARVPAAAAATAAAATGEQPRAPTAGRSSRRRG